MYFLKKRVAFVANCFHGLRVPDLEIVFGHISEEFMDIVYQCTLEFMAIRNGKTIILKYHCFYDDEARARSTVQIKTMKTTLTPVRTCYARAEDCR